MRVGERIRLMRRENKANKVSLATLAKACGITVGGLSKIERGLVKPKLETLTEIAGALRMTVADLLAGTEENVGKGSYSAYAFPPSFQEFIDDPEYENEIDEEWIELLLNTHIRGKYPSTKRQWINLYLNLRQIFGKQTPPREEIRGEA